MFPLPHRCPAHQLCPPLPSPASCKLPPQARVPVQARYSRFWSVEETLACMRPWEKFSVLRWVPPLANSFFAAAGGWLVNTASGRHRPRFRRRGTWYVVPCSCRGGLRCSFKLRICLSRRRSSFGHRISCTILAGWKLVVIVYFDV